MNDNGDLFLRDPRAARAHALLMDQLGTLTSSNQWLAMLDMTRSFHTYSARNVMLLIAQGARGRVAGYRTWQTIPAEGGGTCQVAKGAKALTILAPITRDVEDIDPATGHTTTRRTLVGFKGARVFDESALVRPPAHVDVMPQLLTGPAPERLFDALAEQVHTAGFTFVTGDIAPANGRTTWSSRTVTIRGDLDAAQSAKTLAHELAHIRLHNPAGSDLLATSTVRAEVEAESVAYLVCAHAGLDAAEYTVPYVAHWSGGDLELVQATAERVIDTSRAITDKLDHHLQPHVAPIPETDMTKSPHTTIVEGPNRTTSPRPSHDPRPADAQPAGSIEEVTRAVDADAQRVIATLAAHPDAWGADPEDRAIVERLAHDAQSVAVNDRVATARRTIAQRLARTTTPPGPPEPDVTIK